MSNLALRISTAIVGVGIFGFMLFYCYETFAILFMVLNLLALREFYRLLIQRFINDEGIPLENKTASITYFLSGSLLYILVILGVFISPWFLAVIAALLVYFFVQHQKSVKEKPDIQLSHKVIGWVYITWPFILVSLVAFYNNEGTFQPVYVLGLFFLIWSNDVLAYFTGKRFGKTPLASKISPKKTVEGFMGGLLGSILMSVILVFILPEWRWHWLALGLIVGVVGPLGDLLESVLKRKAGLKDSGRILPGHGGVLDRFDAFLLSAPFVFLYLLWFV